MPTLSSPARRPPRKKHRLSATIPPYLRRNLPQRLAIKALQPRRNVPPDWGARQKGDGHVDGDVARYGNLYSVVDLGGDMDRGRLVGQPHNQTARHVAVSYTHLRAHET